MNAPACTICNRGDGPLTLTLEADNPEAYRLLEQAGFGKELEVTRDARLRLTDDLTQLRDGPFALRTHGQQAKAGFLAGRTKAGQQSIEIVSVVHHHRATKLRGTSGPRSPVSRSRDEPDHVEYIAIG